MVVDESLFGRKTKTKGRGGALPARAAVISAAELRRIQGSTRIITAAEIQKDKDELEAIHAVKHKAARARKDRMRALSAASKNKAKKSTMELEKEARKETIRQMADKTLDENLDLVKYLRGIGARAAAFTIRDQQLNERGAKEARQKAYEDRMDLLMEVDRLRDLKQREDADNLRRKKRVEDRKVITEQIDAIRRKRILEEEQREQESKAMLELIAKYEKEDQEAAAIQKVEQERARMEVMEANKASIERKHAEKQRDRDEEEAILLYQARKDELMRKREQEEKEIQDEKNRLAKAMLDSQEKIMDNSAELDALRARRYAEAKERAAREAVLKKETWRKNLAESVHKTLGDQIEDKKRRQAREAALQEREHNECLRYANKVQDREAIENERKRQINEEFKRTLNEQIAAARRGRTDKFQQAQDEGRAMRNEFAMERAKLEAIRDAMIEDMLKRGYNPNYLNEIRNCDIQKIQMR